MYTLYISISFNYNQLRIKNINTHDSYSCGCGHDFYLENIKIPENFYSPRQ